MNWSYSFVVGWTVVFCKVVYPIFITWIPENFKLSLLHSATQPAEPHIDGFASVLLDSTIDDNICCCVVCFQCQETFDILNGFVTELPTEASKTRTEKLEDNGNESPINV